MALQVVPRGGQLKLDKQVMALMERGVPGAQVVGYQLNRHVSQPMQLTITILINPEDIEPEE